jgi:hypothetical protein
MTMQRRLHKRKKASACYKLCVLSVAISGCQTIPIERSNQDNACLFLQENPYINQVILATHSTPFPQALTLAVIRHESANLPQARPVKQWIIKPWIPWSYYSSAKGYGQITKATWQDFTKAQHFTPNINAYMDNVYFIDWYFEKNKKSLGKQKDSFSAHYLLYHEGPSGYRRAKESITEGIRNYAQRVEETGLSYASTLSACQKKQRWQQQWAPF